VTTLVASDLDQTLVFSPAATARLGGGLPAVVVETIDGVTISEMAAAVRRDLRILAVRAVVLPVTTRTVAQLQRIDLPFAPRFAVAASGGTVLVDGLVDAEWEARTKAALTEAAPLSAMAALLREATGERVREADGLFCYVVADGLSTAELDKPCAASGWRVELQGRKLYLLPLGLDKAAAVAHVAERVGADRLLAAGDSLLDRTMVEQADRGWVPRGSALCRELLPPHVTVTAEPGHAAAAEIVTAWLTSA